MKLLLITLSILCSSGFSEQNIHLLAKLPGKDIHVRKARSIIKKNKSNSNFIILDVRSPMEYKKGHIMNAILIECKSENFKQEISKFNRTKTIIVYCKKGGRSKKATILMDKLGFTNIYNLLGGIEAWKSKGYPLVK